MIKNILEASEEQLLAAYLNSRGINAKFVTKDTKIAHAKSAEYAKWKSDHWDRYAKEEFQIEEIDKEDTITFDIPLLIRVLEYAREDAKTDMDLHKVTEKLISIRNKGTLTMADYDFIVKLKESFEMDKLDEIYRDPTKLDHETVKRHLHNIMGIPHNEDEPTATPAVHRAIKKVSTAGSSPTKRNSKEILRALIHKHHIPIDAEHRALLNTEEKKPKMTALDKFRKAAAEREKKHSQYEKPTGDLKGAIDRLEKHVNKEETEQISQISDKTLSSYIKKAKTSADELDAQKKFGKSLKRRTGILRAVSTQVGRAGENLGKIAKSYNEEIENISESPDDKNIKINNWSQSVGKRPEHDSYYKFITGKAKLGRSLTNKEKDFARSYTLLKQEESEELQELMKDLLKRYENEKNNIKTEDTFQDSYAATQTTGMEITDLPPEDKVNRKQLSKSARIIKSLYKKLNMKEELYDHEKEDKSVATYGKKPTMVKTEKKLGLDSNEPQAAAVLTGGKTLTGQTRDTLEIDPLMRKPGPPIDQNKKDIRDK